VNLPASELAALLVATSFAAGLNVYATLATLGLLSHAGLLLLTDYSALAVKLVDHRRQRDDVCH
jgi:hypothetical protein